MVEPEERPIALTRDEAELVEMLCGRWTGESFLFDDAEFRSIVARARRLQMYLRLALGVADLAVRKDPGAS